MWDLLLRKAQNKQLSFFIGYYTKNIRPNFLMKLKVEVALVDSNDKEQYSIPPKGKSFNYCV